MKTFYVILYYVIQTNYYVGDTTILTSGGVQIKDNYQKTIRIDSTFIKARNKEAANSMSKVLNDNKGKNFSWPDYNIKNKKIYKAKVWSQ
jgi:hypothetical protein